MIVLSERISSRLASSTPRLRENLLSQRKVMNINSAVNGRSDSEVPKAKKLQDDVGSKSDRVMLQSAIRRDPDHRTSKANSAARCQASPQSHHPEPRLLK